jgi:hypothetical protein
MGKPTSYNTGGRGKTALRRFYRDDFIPAWPEDLQMTPANRVVGDGQLVDELRTTFTLSKVMNWLLPNVPPTHRKIVMDIVVVVQFRGHKIACERILLGSRERAPSGRTSEISMKVDWGARVRVRLQRRTS